VKNKDVLAKDTPMLKLT